MYIQPILFKKKICFSKEKCIIANKINKFNGIVDHRFTFKQNVIGSLRLSVLYDSGEMQ